MEKVTEREREIFKEPMQQRKRRRTRRQVVSGRGERRENGGKGGEEGIISLFLFLPLLHCITKKELLSGKRRTRRRRTMERW